MSLLAVGTVAIDAIETPFGKTDRILGGSAMYITMAASFFLPKTNIVAVVGGDFPDSDIQMMKDRGVDLSGLQIKEDQKSFFWSGKYHNDMNTRDTLTTDLNVLADFDPVVPDSYQDTEYLILGNLSPQVQISVIERLNKRPRLIVMDTMNFWIDNTYDELIQALGMVDVLSINDEEARQLSGEYSLVRAASKILKYGPKYVIIKKGENGALLFDHEHIFFAPALPLEEVFDPTGAGDSFAGGFIGYLASTHDTSFTNMKRAVIHGSALASFCVEKFGPERFHTLTDDQLRQRVKEFVDLVQFEIEYH